MIVPKPAIALLVFAIAAALVYFLVVKGKEFFASEVVVTYYFLPQCPWCKKFAPEWAIFKELVAEGKKPVKTAEVDAEKEGDKVPKDIRGFPTVKITKPDGSEITYDGERTAKALMAAVEKLL